MAETARAGVTDAPPGSAQPPKQQQLAIFEESRARKITNHVRIVLPKSTKKRIDLATIQKDWR